MDNHSDDPAQELRLVQLSRTKGQFLLKAVNYEGDVGWVLFEAAPNEDLEGVPQWVKPGVLPRTACPLSTLDEIEEWLTGEGYEKYLREEVEAMSESASYFLEDPDAEEWRREL